MGTRIVLGWLGTFKGRCNVDPTEADEGTRLTIRVDVACQKKGSGKMQFRGTQREKGEKGSERIYWGPFWGPAHVKDQGGRKKTGGGLPGPARGKKDRASRKRDRHSTYFELSRNM